MTNERSTQVVRDYAEAVFQRTRRPLTPAGFQVDWADAPAKHTTFPAAPMLAAPPRPARPLGRLPDLLANQVTDPGHTDPGHTDPGHTDPGHTDPGHTGAGDTGAGRADPGGGPEARPWTAAEVTALADLAYGVHQRRLAANWNQDLAGQAHYPSATWGRGTASGGGMYPLEIYWVAGGGAPVRPGIYHFHTGHRAWQRLASGAQTAAIRAACLAAADEADQFLVVTVRFWKNAFKYHNFCYHVVTQDLGAMLGSWQLIGRGLGRRLRPVLWFADETVNSRLGLDTDEESALAVVPLTGPATPGGPAPDPGPAPTRQPVPARPAAGQPHQGAVRFERSRRVFSADRVAPVHRATLLTTEPRPAPLDQPRATARTADPTGTAQRAEPTGTAQRAEPTGPGVALPDLPARRWNTDLAEALLRRRSSFGRFSLGRRLSGAELGGILGCAAAGLAFPTDLTGPHPPAGLHVLVNDVTGVPAGAYDYHPDRHHLLPVRLGPTAELLQRAYALTNYNLEQVAAVLAVSGNLADALAHYGPRGYRLLNALAGSAVQVGYLAAAALDVGCGAVLGLDNEALDEALGLTGTGRHTLLFALLGHDRPGQRGLDYPVAVPADTRHRH
nr:nitroreductase family protein [Micromonospora sp. DSM 115978]